MVEESSTSSSEKRNINSYYGHKVGFWQSLSLILNAGLMVYAHIGLSGVIFTNQDPSATSGGEAPVVNGTGVCTEADIEIWTQAGGEPNRPIYSTFCSREYVSPENGVFCLSNPSCIATCFQTEYGYSQDCSACLAAIPLCGVGVGCSLVCAADSLGQECQECNGPCIQDMFVCSGLPQEVNDTSVRRRLNSTTTDTTTEGDVCNEWDLNVPLWYRVYDLTFVGSVNDAWNGDAQLLAIIVVFFSGFWPYAKNVILLLVWYVPMSIEWQTWAILWLSRLSKYTLVDVFAVVVVLVGVQLQLNVGGTEAIIRAEPRFGILAFFVATLWEFIQIEVIKAMHEDKVLNVHGNNNSAATKKEGASEIEETAANQETTTTTTSDSPVPPKLYFESLAIPTVLWILSVGLFASGCVTQIVQFTSRDLTATQGCVLSYNLVTLANALVNELGLIDNGVAWQTWVLYIVYLLLNLAFPIVVHLMQAWSLWNWKTYRANGEYSNPELLTKLQKVSLWTSAIWCFACIEVLLIGVFAVEFKFAQLVARLAGDSNAVFLDITSGLGPGFYILIGYSVIAGFLQFTLRVIHPMPGSVGEEEDAAAETAENKQEETNDV